MIPSTRSREELLRIYEEESRNAAELKKGTLYIQDSDGNDIVPDLIATHEKKAQSALEALSQLGMASFSSQAVA